MIFLLSGGKIAIREFNRPEDVDALPEKCIVNCTGLGAMKIFGDNDLVPVSGQLCFLIPQPELDLQGQYVRRLLYPEKRWYHAWRKSH